MFSDLEMEVKESELPHALGAFVANSPYLYRLSIEQLQWMRANGKDAVELFVSAMRSRGEVATKPTRSWREEDGVIYFSVVSDGTTGEDWTQRLEDNGFRVGDYAKQVLRSPDFKPTRGVSTEVAVLKGTLFTDNDRITKKIRAEAGTRKLEKPNAELVCLIREKFADKEIEAMGLWYIVAMHEPINDSDGDPSLLGADRDGGGRWLDACGGRPGDGWRRGFGFAFAVSPASPKL